MQESLVAYAKDDNGVLQRHALFALGELRDTSVIDELPDLSTADELVARAFLEMCIEVDPNLPRCVEYFVAATRRGGWEARHGLAALRTGDAIKRFLRSLNSDAEFRRQFLRDLSYTKAEDESLVRHIGDVLDADIRDLSKQALLACLDYEIGNNLEDSPFLAELWRLLQADDPEFLTEMVRLISGLPDGGSRFHFVTGLVAEVITEREVGPYIDAMLAAGDAFAAFDTMVRVKRSDRSDRETIYELGRAKLSEQYAAWEARLGTAAVESRNREEKLLKEFEKQLEPEPGKFSTSVFRFYKENTERLTSLLRDEHKRRLKELIENTILKFVDPASHTVTITENSGGTKSYTISNAVRMFGDALLIVESLGIDVTPHRQKVLNFIPFAFGDELKAVFRLVRNIHPGELQPIIEMYKSRASDLWKHQPSNLVDAIEQYHAVDAVPILRQFVQESAFDRYTRRKALTVSDSLLPDAKFLSSVFSRYETSSAADERNLADTANALLVTAHADTDAIRWRLKRVSAGAVRFVRPTGVHHGGVPNVVEGW